MLGHRLRPWGLGLLISLVWLLGGCFQADLTLQFDHHHHGFWTQTFTLGERNLAFAGDALEPWLTNLRAPVQRLGGRIQQTPSTLNLRVPFSTPADGLRRFHGVFSAPRLEFTAVMPGVGEAVQDSWAGPSAGVAERTQITLPGVGSVPFDLDIQEQHWGLFSQVHLVYDLDLRTVAEGMEAVLQTEPTRENWVSFRLRVPWGLRSVAAEALPPASRDAHGAQWNLPLGQLSHIDVWFWLPNWVGLGGVVLVLAVLMGYSLRYRWLGAPRE